MNTVTVTKEQKHFILSAVRRAPNGLGAGASFNPDNGRLCACGIISAMACGYPGAFYSEIAEGHDVFNLMTGLDERAAARILVANDHGGPGGETPAQRKTRMLKWLDRFLVVVGE